MKGRSNHILHEVLRQVPYGIHVLTVKDSDGEMNATVVSWAMQCSFFPPLILVAVRKPSRTYELVRTAKMFTLNLIDKHEQELVRQLVKPADMVGDKLEDLEHSEEDGSPILENAFAFVQCKVRSMEEPGDHALVIGEAVHAGFHEQGQPLTCADMGWRYGG
jgi:flavin reductase (DIM6/NTAB) family NADH-FMN oxidoreductase RutF